MNAPLKDPIKYKVLGYEISLRRQEAEMIEVISEEEAKKLAEKTVYHEGLPEDLSVARLFYLILHPVLMSMLETTAA